MLDKEVTIIILTYKSAHIIESCLKNIINKNYRIIIVDNGSNDNIQNLLLNTVFHDKGRTKSSYNNEIFLSNPPDPRIYKTHIGHFYIKENFI